MPWKQLWYLEEHHRLICAREEESKSLHSLKCRVTLHTPLAYRSQRSSIDTFCKVHFLFWNIFKSRLFHSLKCMWTLSSSSIRQLNNEAFSKTSQHKRHVDAHHNWTLIIVGNVHKQGMCDSWHQRPQAGLNEGSDRFPSVPVDQSALFMTVICAHRLCRAARHSLTIPRTQKCPREGYSSYHDWHSRHINIITSER